MSLRVLHVIPSVAACRGGPSKAIIEMVTALNSSGTAAEISTTNDSCEDTLDVELDRLVDYQGAPVRFFARKDSSFSPLKEFQYSSTFAAWLRQNIDNYDVLHIHAIFSFCSTYAMYLARKNGIPYVVRPIGQLEDWSLNQSRAKKKVYLAAIERANLLAADTIHFTANSEAQQALRIFPQLKSKVIPLGVHAQALIDDAPQKLRRQIGVDSETPLILFLSRLHAKKGLELVFEALSLTTQDCCLLIAGDGEAEYLAELKQLVSDQGLTKRIQFLGFVEGKQKNLLLQGADLFVLSSYSENFGIAVLEALSVGTPALVTDEVALAAEINKHDLGYVAQTTVNSVQHCLESALTELAQADRQQRRSRIQQFVAENFQWSAIATELNSLYRQLKPQ